MSEPAKTPTPEELSEKRQESVRVITEQMTELNQVLEGIKKEQSIDKNTAIGLEQISPGVVTDVIPINGFTEKPSRTNYELVVNRVGDRIKVLGDEMKGIILEDEPFEKAEKAEEEAEKTSDVVDELITLTESVEALHGDADSNTLVAMRCQLEKLTKSIHLNIGDRIVSVESLNSDVPAESLIVSLEGAIWDGIKSAMESFWKWIKEVFKKIFDWFKGNDPKKRLAGIDAMLEEFKGDATVYELELSDAEMQKLTLGGKLIPDAARALADYPKLASVGKELLPTVANFNMEYMDALYDWVGKNLNGLTNDVLLKQMSSISEASLRKYAHVVDPLTNAKKYSSVITDTADAVELHYLGGFKVIIKTGKLLTFRVAEKYATGKDQSDVKAGKYKLRGSDAVKVADIMKKTLEAGWNEKTIRDLEGLDKSLAKYEDKFRTIKDALSKTKDGEKVLKSLVMMEKKSVTIAMSAIMTHSQSLKHLEMMERFILGLYAKAKKKGDDKEENKPA